MASYEFKVALDEDWVVSYPASNVPFTVSNAGDIVQFTYDTSDNSVDVTVTPAGGVVPPEIYGHQGDEIGFGFDVEAAQAELQMYMDEAGIEDPGDIAIQLWYNRSGNNQDILEAVEAMWEENLGIDVNVSNMEWGVYLEILDE